jgi:cytochrome c biogenesis protein CcmG, thiol:disulfide interchange protein DsbE
MGIKQILLLTALTAICAQAAPDTTDILGKPAPLFRMQNQNAVTPVQFSLADQFSPDSQHAVIISFFATWCVPCRKELPFLQHYADSLRQDGLRLVAVCVDTVFGAKQKKMVAALKLACPVVSSTTGIIAKRFGVSQELPQTIFIDRHGIVQAKTVGFGEKEISAIRQAIDKILVKDN